MNLVEKAVKNINKTNEFQQFSSGDTVGVYVKVREGEKERVQLFKGVVLKIQGAGLNRSFTVRKVSEGVGVERTFPFQSPSIDKIQVIAYGKTRRSRLFYLRGLRGRAAKITSELAAMREQRIKTGGKGKTAGAKKVVAKKIAAPEVLKTETPKES